MHRDGDGRGADNPDGHVEVPGLGILAAQLDRHSIFHVLRRGDHGADWPIALVELQMGFDGADQEALPIGELRKLQRGLRFGQRLERGDVLRIGNLRAGQRRRERQRRRARSGESMWPRRNFGAIRIGITQQASVVPFAALTGERRGRCCRLAWPCGGKILPPAAGCGCRIARPAPRLRLQTTFDRLRRELLRLAHLLLLLTQQESIACLRTFLESMSKRCCCTGNASEYWRRISPTPTRRTTRRATSISAQCLAQAMRRRCRSASPTARTSC